MKHTWLIAGIPATRKSTFGRWLETNRDFVHVDVEKDQPDSFKGELLSLMVSAIRSSAEMGVFIRRLETLDKSVVIDWGFPVSQLPFVDALKQAGFVLWWFNGERAVARKAFIERNESASQPIPVKYFEIQMDGIKREWSQISRLFSDHIVEVLKHDGGYSSPEQIASTMNI